MRSRVNRGISLLILSLPLLLVFFLAVRRTRDPHFGNSATFDRWSDEDTAAWATKNYVVIGDREALKRELAARPIGGAPLTPEMRDAYWEALLDFLFAYHDGDVESWKKFRFAAGGRRALTTNGVFQVKFFYGLAKTPKRALPDYAPRDDKFYAAWEAGMKTNSPPQAATDADLENLFFRFLREVTLGTVYSNYFTGVCLDEMIVQHDASSLVPSELKHYPFFPFTVQRGRSVDASFPNQGYDYWSNGDETCAFFAVHPTLTELWKQKGTVSCINTFVYIRLNETGTVAPFLIRHFWNPDAGRWVVSEMVDANLKHNRVMAVLF